MSRYWMALFAALLSGALLPLAFAPYGFWWLAFPALAVWFFLADLQPTKKRAFWLGWVFGLGYFGHGISWVYFSLLVYGQSPVAVAVGLTLLLVMYLSLFTGLVGLFYRFWQQQQAPAGAWVLIPLWFVMEQLKAWLITGFPWLSLGYSQVESPLSGFAPVIGVYGLSLILVAMAVALRNWVQQPKAWSNPAVLIFCLLLGWLLQQVEFSEADGEPLKVALVQGNTDQGLKWRQDYQQKIIRDYWSKTQQFWDHDLVVWPEVAIPGKTQALQSSLLDPMQAVAAEKNTQLLVGIIASDWVNRVNYNSMLLLGPQQGQYDKRHLVPFGEYIPLRDLIGFMHRYIRIPTSDMVPGAAQQERLMVNDTVLGVSICYESVFPREFLRSLPEAGLLVNASNDAWFGDSLAPHQHLQIAQMRSLEFARPMVRSTTTGISAMIDHRGLIQAITPQFAAAELSLNLQGRKGSTPLVYLLPWYPWLALVVMLSLLIISTFKRDSRP